jgi:hypothetical protein
MSINKTRFMVADAKPVGGGYIGIYALPGAKFHSVEEGGIDFVFDTEEQAVAAANEAVIDRFNAIPQFTNNGKPDRYKKVSGQYLGKLIGDAEIEPELFAYLLGTNQDRVLRWLRNEEEVSHPGYVLATIFANAGIGEDAIDIAEAATELVTTQRLSKAQARIAADSPPATADSK